ncbi:MAG: triose-phosphate isomerase [Nitrospinae bacterium]|jgi:triosephosphate isomerase (TIM)|nr:triose-phosphate isomerase [Nitrospinota bacterium]MDA1108459.1 triose-phosphate isomerase [Nitrospinota bacterium]
MRRPVIAGNWKMNMLQSEAEDFVKKLIECGGFPQGVDVIIAPPYTALGVVRKLITNSSIQLAGQNIYFEPKGAWTGEISAAMLKDAGCQFVILGHSERRHYFHEDDALINQKIKAALENELQVIFCVGETLEQRERAQTQEVVEFQLKIGLQGLDATDLKNLVIAYEPVWAIGTGRTATPDQAQEVHCFARKFIGKEFGEATSDKIRIQYGGSVNSENSKLLLRQKDIDGVLVGSASLNIESFTAIINFAN